MWHMSKCCSDVNQVNVKLFFRSYELLCLGNFLTKNWIGAPLSLELRTVFKVCTERYIYFSTVDLLWLNMKISKLISLNRLAANKQIWSVISMHHLGSNIMSVFIKKKNPGNSNSEGKRKNSSSKRGIQVIGVNFSEILIKEREI